MLENQALALVGCVVLGLIVLQRSREFFRQGGRSHAATVPKYRSENSSGVRTISRIKSLTAASRSSGILWPRVTKDIGFPDRTLWLRSGPKVSVSSSRVKSNLAGLKISYWPAIRFRSLVRMEAGSTRCVSTPGYVAR